LTTSDRLPVDVPGYGTISPKRFSKSTRIGKIRGLQPLNRI